MLTNRLGLPAAIVRAVENDPYTRGASDISVTSLITPPYQRKLKAENEQVEDVADRMWSLIGQIGHGIVERAYPEQLTADFLALSPAECLAKHGVVAERRLFMPVNGWTVSGQFDLIEDDCLMDYKFTSAWSVRGETKIEWEQQLNLLRLLAIHAGIGVNRLRIIAVLRDWTKGQAQRGGDYPQTQVVPVDIPVWTVERATDYMLERVVAHQSATPPACTDSDRWAKPAVWAVMKAGRKSAVKLHEELGAASNHCASLGSGHTVEHRPGEYTRCLSYCSVSHVCPQFKSEVLF